MTFVSVLTFSIAAMGGGGGGGGGANPDGSTKISRDEKEFIEKTMKVNTAASRIAEADKLFKELVEHKNHARTAREKQQITEQMKEVIKTRNKEVENFHKYRTELTLRYPNEGKKIDYHGHSKRSLDEMEGAVGLDEILTRIHRQITRKFAPLNGEEQGQTSQSSFAPTPAPKPTRLRLEK